MIDIHHHLLFGLDDGPRDLESSVAQAEAAAADGITHIVCTPHANDTYAFRPDLIEERLSLLRERVGDKVALGTGCDFHLSPDNIEDAMLYPAKYTINHGQYLLVEFAEFMIPQTIGDTFYNFTVKGMRPIITHPERNPILQSDPQRMAEWLRTGCLVQVTAASLNGRFGRRAQALVWQLLQKDWVNFIATDAHNLAGRPPKLREAYQAVENKLGAETARRLCEDNPRAVFENSQLPEQPEPKGVSAVQDNPGKHSGLLARLFGK